MPDPSLDSRKRLAESGRLTPAGACHIGSPASAATDYFRRQTTAELTARFQPIVVTSMEAVGVYNYYEDLAGYYNLLPIQKPEAVDLDEYITDRTVGGIFSVLEEEEQRIRQDPAARTTELLRKVFE